MTSDGLTGGLFVIWTLLVLASLQLSTLLRPQFQYRDGVIHIVFLSTMLLPLLLAILTALRFRFISLKCRLVGFLPVILLAVCYLFGLLVR